MSEQAQIFLSRISNRIKDGEFDSSISPFVSKELIYTSIKARVLRKDETGGTPMLTETEINEAIKDAKEIGEFTALLFFKYGVIEKTEDGYFVSKVIEKFLKQL